jgi:RNA polymerase sigma factor (sigma-70 family)
MDRPPNRRQIIDWVALHVLPHEGRVRAWLRRSLAPGEDPDDVIQEAYCRLAGLDAVDHIQNPRAYFFQTCRSIVLEHARRARVVRFETVTEFEALGILDDEPSPERATIARLELSRVRRVIAALPERCRRVIEMRKVEGAPQREIAERLGVSERVVENDATRGLKLILKALEDEETTPAAGRIGKRGKA